MLQKFIEVEKVAALARQAASASADLAASTRVTVHALSLNGINSESQTFVRRAAEEFLPEILRRAKALADAATVDYEKQIRAHLDEEAPF